MRRGAGKGVVWVLVAGGLLLGCEEPPPPQEIIRPVRAIKVQDTEAFAQRYFPGRAAATQEINASFRVSGQLIERPIDVGVEISKGDLVAALDPSTFQAEVDRLEAEVKSAKATRERTQLELDRQQQLFDKGWVTKARLDTVRATAQSARAGVVAAEAALERARLDLTYTTLFAPFDGVVVETYVENFQEVRAKQPVARVVDTSQIEFWVSIPESLISLTPFVREVLVEFDAFPGRQLPASIKEVKREASQTTRAYDVNLIMDQPEDFKVLPGMAGRATATRIDLPEQDRIEGYEVPLAAIYSPEGEQDYIWIVNEAEMTVTRRPVDAIEAVDRGMKVQGVEPGEMVVIAGVEYLREGQKVRLAQ